MKMLSLEQELKSNAYPGRGIVLGKSKDGSKAAAAYFIMEEAKTAGTGIFVEDGEGIVAGIRPLKLTDPA